ncbi:kinesin-like protein KIN-14I isoform X3 [Andrographis paniculata]|uniref:kinesin-like protein KIN-14I isoform X3 n=2 Tax=Andrographis paniculata TaxID=175694 RepID=UPI0021E72CA1|nr:kinesin-like protein KIN-14I isoform X3 [Andrographis paniculata]
MAASHAALPFSVASVVEDVLLQHRNRSRGLDLDTRRAEEALMRRCEAAAWLRKVVGVVSAKDLPAEPSEEEFKLGLRSGIILCNALNKVQPGSVQKVVESPCDSIQIPDGAALSAYQYFENVRNFLVAVEDMGMPTFEASDLEQGGNTSRIVNCILALESYNERKQVGGDGAWKSVGNAKTTAAGKQLLRKNSEPFASSLPRSVSMHDGCLNNPSSSLSLLVRAILLDKNPEEVPNLLESVLSKVVEEFEHRIANHSEMNKGGFRDTNISHGNKFVPTPTSNNIKTVAISKRDGRLQKNSTDDEESEGRLLKQHLIVDQQQKDITELKHSVSMAKAGMQFIQMKFHEELHNLGLHIHGLASAASGYHRVFDENRKLYNQVQDLKGGFNYCLCIILSQYFKHNAQWFNQTGSIRVYCRVRPFLPRQKNYLTAVDHIEEGSITINMNGKGRKSFNFNKVFGPAATQEEVFSDTQPLIRSVLDGYNVCIFAYGQTGSGKTYTMTGPRDLTEHNQGINFRALRDLFLLAEQRKDTLCYNISVQMIEIYNEQVRDLLSTHESRSTLEIRNSSQTGHTVPDASLFSVSTTSDIINLMKLGQRNRAVGATALNDRSSRSHSCLTVHVQGRDLICGNTLRGCMHLVDLAGSERVDKSEATGDRLKEAQHINKSLSALGDVISSLAQKTSHVPYRNSKLTQLLQDSLGGQAKTLTFVHISPEPNAMGETISTLKFAERVASVELGAARVNKGHSADAKDLKEQIASLKAALTRKDGGRKMQEASFQSNIKLPDAGLQPPNGLRKPMIEHIGNIEVRRKSALRQKRQSLDLDEQLGDYPPWLPVSSSSSSPFQHNNGGHDESDVNEDDDYDREVSSGEWVDKLMVNKQDSSNGTAYNRRGCWEANINGNIASDVIYQKYLSDSCRYYSDRSLGLFPADHYQVEANSNDDNNDDDDDGLDVVEETGTCSGSSEPDVFWQFNNSKHGSFSSDSKVQMSTTNSKQSKTTEFRTPILKMGPPRKSGNAAGGGQGHSLPRNGRQSTDSIKGKKRT